MAQVTDEERQQIRSGIRKGMIAEGLSDYHEDANLRILVMSENVMNLARLPKSVLQRMNPLYCFLPVLDQLFNTAILPENQIEYYKCSVELEGLLLEAEMPEESFESPTEALFISVITHILANIDSAKGGERLKRVLEKVNVIDVKDSGEKKRGIWPFSK